MMRAFLSYSDTGKLSDQLHHSRSHPTEVNMFSPVISVAIATNPDSQSSDFDVRVVLTLSSVFSTGGRGSSGAATGNGAKALGYWTMTNAPLA
jgi:hypothetical protein